MHVFEDDFYKNNKPWIYIDTNFQWTTMDQNIVYVNSLPFTKKIWKKPFNIKWVYQPCICKFVYEIIQHNLGLIPGQMWTETWRSQLFGSYVLTVFMCMSGRSLFVLFLLAIVLSVLLRYTDFDYTFGIFKLCLAILSRIFGLLEHKDCWIIWLSNILTMNIPDKSYSQRRIVRTKLDFFISARIS